MGVSYMKKNKLLFTLLSSICVFSVGGCLGTGNKYSIKTSVNSDEYGYVTGSGDYANGQKVSLKLYPNDV